MEPVHEMRGLISLLQGDYAEAVSHFEQGNLDNLYTKHRRLGFSIDPLRYP